MSHLSRNQRVKPMAALFARALALGLVLIFFGCESEPPPPKTAQKVVRKKIDASEKAAERGKTTSSKPASAAKKPASTTQKANSQTKKPAKEASSAKAVLPKSDAEKTQKSGAAQAVATKASSTKAVGKGTQQAQSAAAQKATATSPAEKGAGSVQEKGQGKETALAGRAPIIVVDPFKPLFQKETATKKPSTEKTERKKRTPQTPLEKIDLGQLKLTAIIRTPIGNKALVEESSGKGYIIQKGTWIGVHSGQVEKITDDAVIVEEETENAIGEVSRTKRELKLQKPPGE